MIGLIVAFIVGIGVSISLTPLFIGFLVKNQFGQFIRQDGPTAHLTKRGTPTMGGVVIIFATVLAWFFGTMLNGGPDWSSTLLVFLFVGLGFIGLLDDGIKIQKQRSLGLNAAAKIGGQVLVASLFALGASWGADEHGVTPASTYISFVRPTSIDLAFAGAGIGLGLLLLWVNFLVAAWSNAVNLTDGLDGLATGVSLFAFGAYMFIAYFQRIQSCWSTTAHVDACYPTRDPLGLAVFCGAIIGALVGFLWWNTSPAQIFMGDTGALALGGAFAGLSILTHTQFLAVVVGGLFVLVVLSDVIQVGVFKLTRKRVFRMAPLHHHFELSGWKEVTIVTRFWLIASLFAAIGVGLFYAEWVAHS